MCINTSKSDSLSLVAPTLRVMYHYLVVLNPIVQSPLLTHYTLTLTHYLLFLDYAFILLTITISVSSHHSTSTSSLSSRVATLTQHHSMLVIEIKNAVFYLHKPLEVTYQHTITHIFLGLAIVYDDMVSNSRSLCPLLHIHSTESLVHLSCIRSDANAIRADLVYVSVS